MTNTTKLRARIIEFGYKSIEIARLLGISYQSFSYKLHNKREFKASEIEKLCTLLEIADKDDYFFCSQISQNG